MGRITINGHISSGSPVIFGRRLTVLNVVAKIYYEENISNVLNDYEIDLEDAVAAVDYCRRLQCQTDKNVLKFCSGCVLRTLQDGWSFRSEDFHEVTLLDDIISISKDGQRVFLGTKEELENSDFGKAGWLMAEYVQGKYFKD